MRAWPWALTILLIAVAIAGCRSGQREDPILRLSAAEALAQGKELLAQKKYARARDYLSHAFEVEPNSPTGREALLLVADAYYLQGGDSNYIQAEAKYRDYLNRFPTSDRAAYAQFQIGNSLFQRMEKPDRDQSPTHKALEAYQDLLRLYPGSEYAVQAREQIRLVRAHLAEHEFIVGHFYLRFGLPRSAAGRFEYLLENYPEYPETDKILYFLGLAYTREEKTDKARETFERLRREYPESPYIRRIPEEKG